jgi:hypothetical protein
MQIDDDRRSIIRAMEVARTAETSVDIYLTTRQYIPEDSELHTRRRENLKSHTNLAVLSTFFSYHSEQQT